MILESFFVTELVCFAFTLGICVSILFYERLHLTTGSVVVPAYLALYAIVPGRVLLTFGNALLTFWLIHRLLPRFVVISGRAKFSSVILVSVAIEALSVALKTHAGWVLPLGIGYVMPGLIAHDMGRHGVAKTMSSVGAAGLIVGFVVIATALVVEGLGGGGVSVLQPTLAFDPRWLPLTVLLSAAAASALQRNYGFRAGGFIGGAYISMLLIDPVRLALFALLAFATYVTVTRILMPRMILFGRRKFTAMLLVGTLYSWLAILVRAALTGYGPEAFGGSFMALIGVVLTGLLANDVERVGGTRVAKGSMLSASFCLAATLFCNEFTGARRESVLVPAALFITVSGLLIFGPGLRSFWSGLAPNCSSTAAPRHDTVIPRAASFGFGGSSLLATASVAVLALVLATYVGILPLLREPPPSSLRVDPIGVASAHARAPSYEPGSCGNTAVDPCAVREVEVWPGVIRATP